MPNITLNSGQVIDSELLEFNVEQHHFYLNGLDVTNEVKRNDKRKFVGFSDEQENLRIYNERHPNAPATGSTSTLGIFWDQITTDPLDAPLDALDAGVADILSRETTKIFLVVAALGILFVIYQNRPGK